MGFIDKRALLAPPVLARKTVTIDGIEGELKMRELTVAERMNVLKRFKDVDSEDPEAATRSVLTMVVSCLCNDDDTIMFPESEWEEAVTALMNQSSKAVEGLMTKCQEIQGQGADAVKDAVKNSEATPSDTSSSGSPEISDSTKPET